MYVHTTRSKLQLMCNCAVIPAYLKIQQRVAPRDRTFDTVKIGLLVLVNSRGLAFLELFEEYVPRGEFGSYHVHALKDHPCIPSVFARNLQLWQAERTWLIFGTASIPRKSHVDETGAQKGQ